MVDQLDKNSIPDELEVKADSELPDIDPRLIELMSTVSSQAEIPLDLRGIQERGIQKLKALQKQPQSEGSKAALGRIIKRLEETPILVNLSAEEMSRRRGCF
ncbi:hypothetical protein ACFL3C_04335 [Patescibacteria group bacterium]